MSSSDGEPEINVGAMVTGAMTLAAALAWNESAKTIIRRVAGTQGDGVTASILYAVIVTLVVIVILKIYSRANRLVNQFAGDKKAMAATLSGKFLPGASTPGPRV